MDPMGPPIRSKAMPVDGYRISAVIRKLKTWNANCKDHSSSCSTSTQEILLPILCCSTARITKIQYYLNYNISHTIAILYCQRYSSLNTPNNTKPYNCSRSSSLWFNVSFNRTGHSETYFKGLDDPSNSIKALRWLPVTMVSQQIT